MPGGGLTLAEFRGLSERLLLAALREQELAEQHQRAAQAARESVERWQLALVTGRLSSWELDLTTWPAAATASSPTDRAGPPPADRACARFLAQLHPDDRPGMQAAVRQAIATHTDYAADYRVVRPDGSVGWIAARGRPYYADNGTPLRMLGTTQDITARKQHEEDLEQRYAEEHRARTRVEGLSAEREALLAHIAEGIILADADGRITFLNAAARALLGVTAPSGAGAAGVGAEQQWLLDHAPDLAEQTALARAAPPGATVPLPRRRLRRQDGSDVVIEGSAAPVFAADATRLGAVLALRDVTAAADLERQKDDFLTTVAHDLRSPLTAMRGFSQLLQRRMRRAGPADRAAWLADLAQIDDAAAQMGTMVETLLDLGRLHLGGQSELHCGPTDLVALARRVLDAYRQRTTAHTLRPETAEETLVGWWDADRLERAVGNLVGNAIKYSPAGGDVTVRVWRESDGQGLWAMLAVQDQGIGIPSADLAGLFERFHRGGNVVGRIAGTGIGLMSVRQSAQAHGGSVSVESSEGQGSTFTLRLPLAAPADGASAAR